MRGYGQSDRPEAIDQYTLLHLVGDIVGLLDALGVQQAVIAGHDWGAVVAWHAALLRPDRFRAVIALNLPHLQRSPVAPTLVMPRRKDAVFLRFPQCVSFRDALKTRSTWRFNALMTPMRANIVGPPSVATKIRASIGIKR
jgi:pimeloyl-ACP methyl ester carboxylesterase